MGQSSNNWPARGLKARARVIEERSLVEEGGLPRYFTKDAGQGPTSRGSKEAQPSTSAKLHAQLRGASLTLSQNGFGVEG